MFIFILDFDLRHLILVFAYCFVEIMIINDGRVVRRSSIASCEPRNNTLSCQLIGSFANYILYDLFCLKPALNPVQV